MSGAVLGATASTGVSAASRRCVQAVGGPTPLLVKAETTVAGTQGGERAGQPGWVEYREREGCAVTVRAGA